MLIVADEDIPCVREVFSHLGEVRAVADSDMTREVVRDAEMLLVRSVTKVNEALLEGSRVRFVATATIGTDHVDTDCLRSRGFLTLKDATLGIVGVGNVGSQVDRMAQVLGMKRLWYDPPREWAEYVKFSELSELCDKADAATFHVPLERVGRYATWHMIDAKLLARLKPGTILINTSRGAVHDTAALAEARREGNLAALVLDVWENGPATDPALLDLADIATPHVAGYSLDGRTAGTRMIHEAACRFLDRKPEWPDDVPPHEDLTVELDAPDLCRAVRASYDIEADDRRLREVMRAESADERARGFERLRSEYPTRREFSNWRALLGKAAKPVRRKLSELGFRVEAAGRRPSP